MGRKVFIMYSKKEDIKLDKEQFERIEAKTEEIYGFGCGYWRVCSDRGCPCALTGKGFDAEIYKKMRKRSFEE